MVLRETRKRCYYQEVVTLLIECVWVKHKVGSVASMKQS